MHHTDNMGKNKLRKFAEMETLDCVFQFPYGTLHEGGCPLRGRWREIYFKNDNPLVLELGCGKGEYAVGMGQHYRDINFIGVDIKGARMYTGAKWVEAMNLTNVAFLRTDIDLIEYMFAAGEVDELWLTFPDPQMKKVNKRLTGTRFLDRYRRVLTDGGIVHLKTDSPFLYTYTREVIRLNQLPLHADISDVHGDATRGTLPPDLATLDTIKTYYEHQWMSRGLTIKYLEFSLPHDIALVEPDIEIEFDTYRSFHRGHVQTDNP